MVKLLSMNCSGKELTFWETFVLIVEVKGIFFFFWYWLISSARLFILMICSYNILGCFTDKVVGEL